MEIPYRLVPLFFHLVNSLLLYPNFIETQVQCLLNEDYEIPMAEAAQITQTFLENFRSFPENLDYSLAEWREMLWRQALGETYQEIAGMLTISAETHRLVRTHR